MDGFNLTETITHRIVAEIGNLTDEAFIDAIRRWAERENANEVYLMDSGQIKEVFRLGVMEYKRIYGNLQPLMCNKMEFRDGRQVGSEWRTVE